MLRRTLASSRSVGSRRLCSTLFGRGESAVNPAPRFDVPNGTLSSYGRDNKWIKKRDVPIQLRQSGGDLATSSHRMLIDQRTRKGPFHHLSQKSGAWAWTHYNHMYHPRAFFTPEEGGLMAEYEQLTTKVALINVAVERQIQVVGPDAEAFVDMVITRDARLIKPNTAKYVIMCNTRGGIINDPVLLRLSEDKFWFSLADSDAGLWLEGVNAFGQYDVDIREIDVAPLSLAGPKALPTMSKLIGTEEAEGLKYYGLLQTQIDGLDVVVARTGFSSEANFEIYLHDATRNADGLYHAIMDAGEEFGIREICIPHHSRIEGGMLSYGQDVDMGVNPFEVGLEWQVAKKLKADDRDFIGKAALKAIKKEGITHQLVGLCLGGKPIESYPADFYHVRSQTVAEAAATEDHVEAQHGPIVGYVTSAWYSPNQESNIAMAYLPIQCSSLGEKLSVALPAQYRDDVEVECVMAEVVPVPFKAVDSAESRTGMKKTGSKLPLQPDLTFHQSLPSTPTSQRSSSMGS